MRLLSPETLRIVATQCSNEDFDNATVSRKQIISHAFVEVLKFKASGKSHPKMWIYDDEILGIYLRLVYDYGCSIGCNFNVENLIKYDELYIGFSYSYIHEGFYPLDAHFDKDYLFSDCVSLYLKGVNIFKYVFGDDWRKYVPIENLKEIKRIIDKTLSKEKEIDYHQLNS